MAARRAAILKAARELLEERTVNDVSLRELSRHVGLSKSNVTRYFDSREAVFLALFDQEFRAYLAELSALLGEPRGREPNFVNEIRVATILAESFAERRLLCELMSAMAGVLERNLSVQSARDFKVRISEDINALNLLIAGQLWWLQNAQVVLFTEGLLALVAGMYPFSNPIETVAQALAELGQPDPRERYIDSLRENLVTWLMGAAVRSDRG
ncbi:TetR family transcriptional regulator [Nocardia sp. NPDC055029]